MKKTRRRFSAAFKAEVAIEALKERETLSELCSRYGIHSNLIKRWKQEFVERSAEIFETSPPEQDFEAEKEKLYAKIGKLEMERDWLKKISNRTGA
ncbi:MAG: transposase [Lentimicrobium sp.]|nr:transposase [Lentimicrobium sp.]